MSARRKHVRSHVHDVDVEIVSEEGDAVCRVEEVKGGNVIEVRARFFFFSSPIFFFFFFWRAARAGATFVLLRAVCVAGSLSLSLSLSHFRCGCDRVR
jgi:hypothetical protein